jgi:hypothetical protein
VSFWRNRVGSLGVKVCLKPAILVIALALAGCTTGHDSGPVPGTIAGVADPCIGSALPHNSPIPRRISLQQHSKPVASEVVYATTTNRFHSTYRFTEPPGTYVVTSDQQYVTPLSVKLASGGTVRAGLLVACK